jgi:hypothetical protein
VGKGALFNTAIITNLSEHGKLVEGAIEVHMEFDLGK